MYLLEKQLQDESSWTCFALVSSVDEASWVVTLEYEKQELESLFFGFWERYIAASEYFSATHAFFIFNIYLVPFIYVLERYVR